MSGKKEIYIEKTTAIKIKELQVSLEKQFDSISQAVSIIESKYLKYKEDVNYKDFDKNINSFKKAKKSYKKSIEKSITVDENSLYIKLLKLEVQIDELEKYFKNKARQEDNWTKPALLIYKKRDSIIHTLYKSKWYGLDDPEDNISLLDVSYEVFGNNNVFREFEKKLNKIDIFIDLDKVKEALKLLMVLEDELDVFQLNVIKALKNIKEKHLLAETITCKLNSMGYKTNKELIKEGSENKIVIKTNKNDLKEVNININDSLFSMNLDFSSNNQCHYTLDTLKKEFEQEGLIIKHLKSPNNQLSRYKNKSHINQRIKHAIK